MEPELFDWHIDGTKWCEQGFPEPCYYGPCLEVQEVRCCYDCWHLRNCSQPCPAFRKPEVLQ